MTKCEILPRTFVCGTPRGYGNSKVSGPWIECVRRQLGRIPPFDASLQLAVGFEFLIWPGSPNYFGQGREHGTDLDNLIKQTIDALSVTKSDPPGLRLIPNDAAIYEITASKRLVQSDGEMGVWVQIWSLNSAPQFWRRG